MCAKSLSCPLCCQSNFPNIDALRISLLKVTSRPLKCPICADELLGLDKLTIHLFGHSILGPEDGKNTALAAPVPNATEKKKPNTANQLKSVRKSRKESTPRNQTQESTSSSSSNNVKCDRCGDEFRDQSLLQMHTSVFHEYSATSNGQPEDKPENRFQCTVCPKAFKMKGSLKIHMRVVHLGCPTKKTTSVSSPSASSGVSSTTTTAAHINSSNTLTTATVAAPVYQSSDVIQHCSMQNSSPPPLALQSLPAALHQSSSLTISTSPLSQPQIIKIIDPRQLAEFIYVTNQQQQQQQQQQVVDRVLINSTPPSVPSPKDICNSIPPSPSQQPSPQAATQGLATASDSNKQWECDVCLKSFTTKYFLKKHKRLHTGEMPYSCQICGKAFTFQQSYHKHLLYHSDEKPHICAVCGRAFKELSTLHNHERIHSGEKPFSCETCGKCFRQRVSYLVHRRIHTNTQPYKCTACDKSFRYKVSQRTHKCPAQPPGTVVRQTGDLLQKLLQSSAILPTLHEPNSALATSMAECSPPLVVAPPSSVETDQGHDLQEIKSEEYINRTLDELFNESYDKMGIGSASGDGSGGHASSGGYESHQHWNDVHHQPTSSGHLGEPSSIVPRIENLCLMSPGGVRGDTPMTFDGETMEVIDSYKLDLLYN